MDNINYTSLKKNSTDKLKKLYESAVADKKLYEKKIKLDEDLKVIRRNDIYKIDNIVHYNEHIRQANKIKLMIEKIMAEREKDGT